MLGQLALNGKTWGQHINVLLLQGFGKRVYVCLRFCSLDLIFQKHCSLST